MTEEGKEIVDIMKDLFNSMSSDIKEFKKEVRADISGIKMLIENETNKNIDLLVEGHSGLWETVEPLKALPDKVDRIEEKVDIIAEIVTGHSSQINQISKVR